MRRDEVYKAIRRTGPAYVPIYFFNRDQEQSDIVAADAQFHFQGPCKDHSEWGFRWERLDETMGQPQSYLLRDWSDLATLAVPPVAAAERFRAIPEFLDRYRDRFRLAALGLSGFTTMWCLRGFEQLMLDIALEPDKVQALAELVFGFEMQVIAELPRYHFDAVAFFDDWGTQQGPLIAPATWRRLFKPYYVRQFAQIHALGMLVYFHSCGQILPLIPDLIEAGVDVLNISQPNLYAIPELGRRFGDQVCFICPVSYQTTSITGTRAQPGDLPGPKQRRLVRLCRGVLCASLFRCHYATNVISDDRIDQQFTAAYIGNIDNQPTKRHLTCGILRHFRAFSSLRVFPAPKHCPRLPTRR